MWLQLPPGTLNEKHGRKRGHRMARKGITHMNEQGQTVAILFIITFMIATAMGVYDQLNEPEEVIIERIRYGTIREMQEFAGVEADDVWGPETDRAYREVQSKWQFDIDLENIKLADQEGSK